VTIRSKASFSRKGVAALALAASLAALQAGPAAAQWFRWPSWDSALSPGQVERMIGASGYRLTGPVQRSGPIYLANVLGRDDDLERLVIDARDGRLLQRYAVGQAGRRLAATADWGTRPRIQTNPDDDWLDRDDDSPPRPPGGILDGGGETAPRLLLPSQGQVARGDDYSGPHVILAPPGASPEPPLERPKPKPQAKHKKPDATPLAQPAANPGAPTPPRPDAAAEPAPAAPRVADTKTAPEPEVVPAAPASKPAANAPNDVPVAPLE